MSPAGWPPTVAGKSANCRTKSCAWWRWPQAKLGADLLSPRILGGPAKAVSSAPESNLDGLNGGLRERMEQLEQQVLQQAMRRHRGNKSRAARELGLSRVGLRAKLLRYGLEAAE